MIVRSELTWVITAMLASSGTSRGGERGKVFPGPRRLGAPPSLINTEKGVPNGFFLT